MNHQIINKGETNYPARLLGMKPFMDVALNEDFDSPERLYVSGACLDLLNAEKTISVVGTRSPFYKAFEIGELIGKLAASRGITIVSGYATGIDTSGHLGAMDSQGNTIAVLGSGINVRVPQKPSLERYVIEKGIFVSEQENPNEPRGYKHLMSRDRITAGLSDAIFVIDTDPKGGAVHTAMTGKEQGRKVYAIDWDSLEKYKSKHLGGNPQVISDGIATAIPILDAEERFEQHIVQILEELLHR